MKLTIEQLKEKTWYRFLKVIYALAFIIIIVFAVALIFDSTSPRYDNDNSYIKCNNGKEFKLSELNKNGTHISGPYIDTGEDRLLNFDCIWRGASADPNIKGYKFIGIYTARNWFKIMWQSLLSIAIALIIFEVIKRIFYYILLGKFMPKKMNK